MYQSLYETRSCECTYVTASHKEDIENWNAFSDAPCHEITIPCAPYG